MSSTLPARLVAATLASTLALVLTACSAPAAPSGGSASAVAAATPTPTPEPPKPVDLSGEWTQINGKSETSFQSAVITGDTIEVQWNAPDLAAIY